MFGKKKRDAKTTASTPLANIPEDASAIEVAEALAARDGLSLEDYERRILHEMRGGLSRPPSKDCVYLYELEEIQAELSENPGLRRHVTECEFCKGLFDLLQPDPELEEQFFQAAKDGLRCDISLLGSKRVASR